MDFAGRCIGVRDFGGAEVLTAFDDVKTLDGPDRVVLRNRYCGVNPVDVSFRTGRMRAYAGDLGPGLVLGMECAGEVVASRSPRLPVGAVVNALTLPGAGAHAGSYAEYVAVDADHAAPLPFGLAADAAAVIPLNGVTASSIVDELSPGTAVAITGAAGALGRFLVSAASAAGLTTIAIARPADEPLLRRIGADLVLDGAALESDGAPPVDAIVDAAGLGPALTAWFSPVDTIVAVRADTVHTLAHRRRVDANVRRATRVADRLAWWNRRVLRRPEIVGPIERFVPNEVAAAQERLATRHRRGRVVLRWWECGPVGAPVPAPSRSSQLALARHRDGE
ncbi:hypothetical protein LB823_14900 [Tsukamurella sp. M9C]|uniref:alcohol dehydrogenase catalytic domain-containing protein n=1 Tax=Tsukamurella sp. M9C TaxID=2877520 RepID=UPI001CCE58A8|nr:hypothetical protein [Tsukamurella sp. M9C]MCA0157479.1 hypothetical protein [Tsukamurella sp. M9C]